MNWDLIWTTIGLAVASFIILPFYIAMLIAYKKIIRHDIPREPEYDANGKIVRRRGRQ
jgi:hypothetical protein